MRKSLAWLTDIGVSFLAGIAATIALQRNESGQPKKHSTTDQSASPDPALSEESEIPEPTEGQHRSAEQAHWRWQRQTEHSRNWIGGVTLGISTVAAIAAGLSFWQSYRQANAAQDQLNAMQADGRAWVGTTLAQVVGTLSVGKEVTVTVDYNNFGRSPGIEGDFVRNVLITDHLINLADRTPRFVTQNIDSCRLQNTRKSGFVAFPTTNGGTVEHIIIPGRDIDDLVVSGEKTVAVMGCISYRRDISIGHTAFCYFLTNGKTDTSNMPLCLNGAYTD